jgi:lysophospholipase L1-like esterase
MQKRLTLILVVLFSVFVATITRVSAEPSARQRHLYVIGDSWADLMMAQYGTIDAELAQRGLGFVTTFDYAVGGSTARAWVADAPCGSSCAGFFTEMKTALANDGTNRPIVFITLGGNDLLGRYRAGPGVGNAVFDEIEADLDTIVSDLLAARSDALIVIGGYDILNFQSSFYCSVFALFAMGADTPRPVNALFLEGQARQSLVASRYGHVTAVNVAGALQGSPGNPNYSTWSPTQYVDSDCIHLTAAGFEIYMDAIFDQMLGADVSLFDS